MKESKRLNMRNNQAGQIVLEYVLLLVVAVAMAALLTTTLVSRNPESTGMIVLKWHQIIQTIGADTADDLATSAPAGPTP